MGAPDDFLYEYAVVRYVPRVDREEFMNIGLVMMCKRRKWLMGRIELDIDRVRSFDRYVDIRQLQENCSIFERGDLPSDDLPTEEKYRWLTAVKSAVLQVSASHPGIIRGAENVSSDEAKEMLRTEFERLMGELVRVGEG